MAHLILDKGTARRSSPLDALAMQGIQQREVQDFKLSHEAPALMEDLAGNAFTTNILAAFLLAGLLVL